MATRIRGTRSGRSPRRAALLALLVVAATIPPMAGAGPLDDYRQESKLTASDGNPYSVLGFSVSLDGDTALAGAPIDDNANGNNAGAAHVYIRDDGSWSEQAKLTASDGASGDELGRRVSLDGDHALVGAWKDDVAGKTKAGSVYVFARTGGSWIQEAKLTAPNPEERARFGSAVSLDGDRALVGEPDEGDNNGTAHVYARDGGAWTHKAAFTPNDNDPGDQFGEAVSLDGDTAVLSAPGWESWSGWTAGVAYVFSGSGGSWTQETKLTNPTSGDDLMGERVSLDGDTALVGNNRDDGGADVGAAHVYERGDSGWYHQETLTASDGEGGDHFGLGLDLDGDRAVVGAWKDDNDHGNGAGAAYVFEREDGSWSQQTKLNPDDATADQAFGFAVDVDGPTTMVGAFRDDNENGDWAGAAYVFDTLENNLEEETQDDAGTDGDASDDPGDPTMLPGGKWIPVNGTLRPQTDTLDAYGSDISANTTTSMNFTFTAPIGQRIVVELYDPDGNLVDQNTTGPLGNPARVNASAGPDGNLTAGTWTTVLRLQNPLPAPMATGPRGTPSLPAEKALLFSSDDDDDYEGERRCRPNC